MAEDPKPPPATRGPAAPGTGIKTSPMAAVPPKADAGPPRTSAPPTPSRPPVKTSVKPPPPVKPSMKPSVKPPPPLPKGDKAAKKLERPATPMPEEVSAVDELLSVDEWDLEEQRTDLLRAALAAPDAAPKDGAKSSAPPPPSHVPALRMPTAEEMSGRPFEGTLGDADRTKVGASIAPKAKPGARVALSRKPAKEDPSLPRGRREELVDLLHARDATLEGGTAEVLLERARVHLELSLVDELLGTGAEVVPEATAALGFDPKMTAAHAALRRARHVRPASAALIGHLDEEIAGAPTDAVRADLAAERARLLEASGEKREVVRAAWEKPLGAVPDHAGALKGLELAEAAGSDADSSEALAEHLAKMADAYVEDGRGAKLAAWLHVERAHILDKRLGKVDAAWAALERALALDPGVGPVRTACVRHAAAHRDAGALADLLEAEALLEAQPSRAARLELDAACIAEARLSDVDRAKRLLERAAQRAPTVEAVDRYVLDELVRLYEASGAWTEAARARRARLTYVTDSRAEAFELRSLAALAERGGDVPAATRDIERALLLDPNDPAIAEELDRLLAHAGRTEARVALFAQLAARTEDPKKRARALVRASRIAEEAGRTDDALTHLRAAWIAAPHDAEVLDRLASLLTTPAEGLAGSELRARVALYAHAADHADDPARRVAYLEKVALLWEEALGEAAVAAKTYEAILALEPGRRSAVLGLERTAARAKDAPALARALLEEAKAAAGPTPRALLTARAAAALAASDPERARSLADEAVRIDAACDEARALVVRLHEEAGRWGQAAEAVGERLAKLDAKSEQATRVALWLAQADMFRSRLNDPARALVALEGARAADPAHPVPPEAIVRELEALGDHRALRAACEKLAASATDPAVKARWLVRTAAISELRLGDDEAAASQLAEALALAPGDELIVDRLVRVLLRVAPLLEAENLLSARMQGGGAAAAKRGRAFERAMLLLDSGDAAAASKLVEVVLEEEPNHVPALRMQEIIARATGAVPLLANALSQQADAFPSERARLGALWALAGLIEWKLPQSPGTDIYERILRLAPRDRAALDGSLRRSLREARHGDAGARRRAAEALRVLLDQAGSDTSRLALHLAFGLLLEGSDDEATQREALESFAAALRVDPRSVTAATGAGRLASLLKHTEHGLLAATALADLARDPKARARYLFDAADLLLAAQDASAFGSVDARRARAADLLEKALEADPESIPVAGRLATVRADDKRNDLLVEAFRRALVRASSSDAIVLLGAEVCRIARTELKNPTMAIEAMRRVREVAPKHVPTLLTLAELFISERAFAEAVEALETVVACATDAAPKLTALFALASLYENVVARGGEVERVLRDALKLDPHNARALRGLVRILRSKPAVQEGEVSARAEVAELLGLLAQAEPSPEQKQVLYTELSELKASLGDLPGAERALVEAAAQAPTPEALAKLSAFHQHDGARDVAAFGRSLTSVVTRAEAIGRTDASWLSTLGQLEVESLGRPAEGIAHLRKAVGLAPDLHEARVVLAAALLRAGFPAEAVDHVQGLLLTEARPLFGLRAPLAALELLEQAFAGDRRMQEALVAREVRALAGGLDDAGRAWLRARRLPHDAAHDALDRGTLFAAVVPPEGRGVLLQIAAAGYGTEVKALRTNPGELGLSARDRIGHRSGHPLRVPFERLMRTLHLEGLELLVSDQVATARVFVQDTPWIVFPQKLVDRPESSQVAALARAMTRVALGVPWIEEMPPAHALAYLVAVARQGGAPGFAADLRDRQVLDVLLDYEPRVAHGIGRRQRKQVSEMAHHLESARAPTLAEVEATILAVTRAEVRAAFLLTGDLMATLDEVRATDAALARVPFDISGLAATWAHPLAGDVARYALAREATALRFRLGTAWG